MHASARVRFLRLLALCLLLAALSACASKISLANFEKIKTGMSLAEVTAILGEPTGSKGVDVGVFSGTSATWKSRQGTITVQFVNGNVVAKTFSRSDTR